MKPFLNFYALANRVPQTHEKFYTAKEKIRASYKESSNVKSLTM